ncbi:hypothetical protein JVU11DRAFT_2964 [Chiua virens]|nr:hypothetical protein JVU11DRAFT_2964 [Chiua virens]
MHLSILPILLAGASIASSQLNPSVSSTVNPTANANIRFGHALANANVNGNDYNVATGVVRTTVIMTSPEGKDKSFAHHFCGASLREKAIRISNAFRHCTWLASHRGWLGDAQAWSRPDPTCREDHHHRGHHGRHGHHGHRGKSFLRRIHKAIKALGPWEGRAVAFVLGCGIGVLLRMFWVLSVLAYRTVRGERAEETLDHEYILYGPVPETLFVAPPQYIDDEKVSMEAHEETEEEHK